MLDLLTDPNVWAALLTLTALEVILGIDNIVFLSILVDRLPPEQRKSGRLLGLGLAMGTRLLLLLALSWLMSLEHPLFHIPWAGKPEGLPLSGKDLILLGGGLFLMAKAVHEIHEKLDTPDDERGPTTRGASFLSTLIQIALIDIVFSLDSIITAVGMASQISVMMLAVILSVALMMLASGPIAAFISRHPSMKMLALSFLILIGTSLVGEALHFSIPKGYIYFAMAFSLAVECLNLRLRKSPAPHGEGI